MRKEQNPIGTPDRGLVWKSRAKFPDLDFSMLSCGGTEPERGLVWKGQLNLVKILNRDRSCVRYSTRSGLAIGASCGPAKKQ